MNDLEKGMTLIELTVVLLILIALAGLAIPYVSGTNRMAMCQATDATMQAVKQAIMGGSAGTGLYGDTLGYYPKGTKAGTDYSLKYLFIAPSIASSGGWDPYNPKTAIGWRGPYLMTGFTLATSGAFNINDLSNRFTDATNNYVHDNHVDAMSTVLDAWGRPVVIQIDPSYGARLVSAGSGQGVGFINGDLDTLIADSARQGDDRVLNLVGTTPANIPCNEL